jgi:hypothetical protein
MSARYAADIRMLTDRKWPTAADEWFGDSGPNGRAGIYTDSDVLEHYRL